MAQGTSASQFCLYLVCTLLCTTSFQTIPAVTTRAQVRTCQSQQSRMCFFVQEQSPVQALEPCSSYLINDDFSGFWAAACQCLTLFGRGTESKFNQASMSCVQLLWHMQRHAAVVHKHHMLWRCWQGWQAFMHVGWHKRAQLNTAMRHEHNSLTWRAFSSWQQQWKAYHCWLNLQQQRRLKHHLLR